MRDNFFGDAGWDNMDFSEWSESMEQFFESAARVMKKRWFYYCIYGYY